MAQLIPSADQIGPVPARKRNEYKTARLLEEYLPHSFKVFHSVHWTTQSNDKTFFGEIDFVVMSPQGRLLLIEQKNGSLVQQGRHLLKKYGAQEKDVQLQMNRGADNLVDAFEARCNRKLDLDLLLYCPDFLVPNKAAAGIPAGRIVDQPQAALLPDIILDIMADRGPHKFACTDTELIESFLSSSFRIRFDIGFLGQMARSAYVEQAAGLSEWVGSMRGVPFRLLVEATAGSGKSQLALDELHSAALLGQSALYVCFNRQLAVDMKKACGRPEAASTFHELARLFYEAQGFRFQAGGPDFEKSTQYFIDHAESLAGSFDVLLIDEAQDFEAEWLAALFKLCSETGRLIVLKDSNQSLYARTPFDFHGWMQVDHPVTYRCPRIVVDHINEFGLTAEPLLSRSPIEGLDTLVELYESGVEGALQAATARLVNQLIEQGHAMDEIAVLTVRGAESSGLLQADRLGGFPLRKIVGRNTEGDFEYSEGELFVDTVFRFKGRSANCVVLTEIDFEALTENMRRRLFVGMTRARLRLGFVITQGAAALLEGERMN